MSQEVTDRELNQIPLEHRRTIAMWLLERGESLRPSWVCPEAVVVGIRDVLVGAAVDLLDPGSEDSTLGHASRTLAGLAESRRGR